MVLHEIEGDLLETEIQVIAQQCNCITKTGRGLALKIKRRFPWADFYSQRTEPSRLGTIELRGSSLRRERYVVGMYAQWYPGRAKSRGRDTSEERHRHFQSCLNRITRLRGLREVAFPFRIGCGMAGGEWEIYRAMIVRWASLHPEIEVYILRKE